MTTTIILSWRYQRHIGSVLYVLALVLLGSWPLCLAQRRKEISMAGDDTSATAPHQKTINRATLHYGELEYPWFLCRSICASISHSLDLVRLYNII